MSRRQGGALPSYGELDGPWISTSKYRRLSSWGMALIPGTLLEDCLVTRDRCGLQSVNKVSTYGSAISLSVSLTILLGKAMAVVR